MPNQPTPFVPEDFIVPETFETAYFKCRMLAPDVAERDYEAVMTSIDHLQGVFGPEERWPLADMTLEYNREDLAGHREEFLNREAFAYTVLSPDEKAVLGCFYIEPSGKRDYDALMMSWVRKSEYDRGLDPILFQAVKEWIAERWPFKNVAYPLREIDWETWRSLP